MTHHQGPLHTQKNVQWIFLFDAVGTLLFPRPPVVDTYFEFGRRFGSRLTEHEVQSRFAQSRRDVFGVNNNSIEQSQTQSCPSSEKIERELWFKLVQQIFDDLESSEDLFEELWTHFALPENWEVFPDVGSCFEQLKRQKAIIGIASNFDSRLIAIAKNKNLLGSAEHIFCSSQVGFRKPDLRFYRAVMKELARVYAGRELRFAMIGDDFENDCLAPASLGWQTWCLVRNGRRTGNERTLADLHELTSLGAFDSTKP